MVVNILLNEKVFITGITKLNASGVREIETGKID
jgi:hypothetical protein